MIVLFIFLAGSFMFQCFSLVLFIDDLGDHLIFLYIEYLSLLLCWLTMNRFWFSGFCRFISCSYSVLFIVFTRFGWLNIYHFRFAWLNIYLFCFVWLNIYLFCFAWLNIYLFSFAWLNSCMFCFAWLNIFIICSLLWNFKWSVLLGWIFVLLIEYL